MKENGVTDEIASRLQYYGVLAKKSNSQQSNKWTKRFFVIKDSLLAYYPDSEKKDFEKRKFFNIHAKGVYSLGNAVVEPVEDVTHPFCIEIQTDICGKIILAAENNYEREKWLPALRQAARVTWNNVALGDTLIHQLESDGLEMAKEKQLYLDKYQSELIALQDEKNKTEELEKVKQELEKEKEKMERLAQEMKLDYQQMKSELHETVQQMELVEKDKHDLMKSTHNLHDQLQSLEEEKKAILDEMNIKESETMKLFQENADLSTITNALKSNLGQIEEKTKKLLLEKSVVEEKLRDKEEQSLQLEAEKEAISDHAQELKDNIKDMSRQKALQESELKEEILARIRAEQQLKEAGQSLARIDAVVSGAPVVRAAPPVAPCAATSTTAGSTSGSSSGSTSGGSTVALPPFHPSINVVVPDEAVREEIRSDVNTLKRFFENLAFEAKLDADKSVMIKNSIHARKSFVRRASTLRFEARRKHTSRAFSMKLSERSASPHHLCSNKLAPPSPSSLSNISDSDSSVFADDPKSPTMTATMSPLPTMMMIPTRVPLSLPTPTQTTTCTTDNTHKTGLTTTMATTAQSPASLNNTIGTISLSPALSQDGDGGTNMLHNAPSPLSNSTVYKASRLGSYRSVDDDEAREKRKLLLRSSQQATSPNNSKC